MTYGFAGHIGLAIESTFGTAVAPTDYFEAMSEDVSTTLDRFETRNIINGYYAPDDAAGVFHNAGSIGFAAFPDALGYFLRGVCGAGSSGTTGATSGTLFTTNFFPRQSDASSTNPMPPYTFEIFRDVTSVHQYAGGQVAGLSMSISPNGPLMVQANVMAQSVTHVTNDGSVTYPTTPTAPFTFDTASLSIGGVAEALVETFTINIDNQLEGIPALNNSTNIARFRRTGPPIVRVSGTVDFLNINKYLDFLNQTENVFTLNFTKTSSFALVFSMPRVVYTAFPLGTSGRGRNTVGFEGIARYSSGSGHSFVGCMTCLTSYAAF